MSHVFLSYRQESEAHKSLVRALAVRLEKAGLSVTLDQFSQEREFHGGGPDEGWARWSMRQAESLDHRVLIVGNAAWFSCYMGRARPGEGLGAAAEAHVILARLFNAAWDSRDIRIVIFEEDLKGVPLELQQIHRFLDPRDFKDLVRWLSRDPNSAEEAALAPNPAQARSPDPAPVDWPLAAPVLDWSMADHDRVRDTFAQLITRESLLRYLPIQGASETGKSQITRQLLNNALRCPGLACGRFDFKGTIDVGAELEGLARSLSLDVPKPDKRSTLVQRLSSLLSALTSRARPTVLIFDTFEAAGAAEQWVKEHLLMTLIRAPWLRVVIAGQHVPERAQTPWEVEACRTIQLSVPAPEDWYTYGRQHNADVTLEFIQTAHRLCRGKPSVLAPLLGPGQ